MAKPGPKRVLRVCGALTREKSKLKEQTQKNKEKTFRVATGPEPGASNMNIRNISVRGEARRNTNHIKPRKNR